MNNRSRIVTVTLNPAVDKTGTIEEFAYGGLNRIRTIRIDAGGKGINVAKALRNFGADVTACGILSGTQGRFIMEKLSGNGIDARFVEAGDGETRTNLKIFDEQTKETTEFNEPGFTVNDEEREAFIRMYETLAAEASIIVLGGSLPQGVPPDFYRTLIEIGNKQGARTVLDADGDALRYGIQAVPYAVKPNLDELEALFGRPLTSGERIAEAARSLMKSGISIVAVSMGGDGSILLDDSGIVRAKPEPITPLSTVGAGDSMVAALVYCMLRDMSLEETARWCSAAGTVTASKSGTQVCTLEEVRSLLPTVGLSKIV